MPQKQHNYSTYESRRNTEIMASRFKDELKYDINDYLPANSELPNYQYFSFNSNANRDKDKEREKSEVGYVSGNWSQKEREGRRSEDVGMRIQMMEQIKKLQQSKNQQINIIKSQFQQQHQSLSSQIQTLQSHLQSLTTTHSNLQTQHQSTLHDLQSCSQKITTQTQTIKTLEQTLSKMTKEKSELQLEIGDLRRRAQRRGSNVRMFYQKYEVVYEPRLRHSYTVQVQTEATQQQKVEAPVMVINDEITKSHQPHQLSGVMPPEISNRRSPSTSKSQLYQLYQQQQYPPNQPLDFHNQITSRSQVLPSATKPKKPTIIQNTSERIQKQNDRRRINTQRIEARLATNTSQEREKEKERKMKMRNQEIQIYPIQCDRVEDIVYGILAMK